MGQRIRGAPAFAYTDAWVYVLDVIFVHQTKKGNEWRFECRINRRPNSLPRVSDNALDWERLIEHRKSSVRCKVEWPFRTGKCQFDFRKTVYRGLRKNENRLYALFASGNLYALAMAGRSLMPT